jgi:predicted permease
MWLRDVKHAWRAFVTSPGFSAIAVISIACGTGANVAIFSVADAILLRPLPVQRPSEMVTVGSQIPTGLNTVTVASHPDYVDIRQRARSFSGLAAFTSRRVGFSPTPGAPPRMTFASLISDNYFKVLGVEPHLGRDFLPEETEAAGGQAVAILSFALWQHEFAGDPEAIGRTVRIAGVDFTIVGITPERFTGVEGRFIREAVYVPLGMWMRLLNNPTSDPLMNRDDRALTVRGRLKPDATIAGARAELALIAADLAREYPATNRNYTLSAVTEMETRFERNPLDSWLIAIMSMLSTAVLTVACANVAGLLASRAPARAREIAMRLAIGAGRAQLVRQFFLESLVVALAGAIGGIAIGYAGILLLRQIELPSDTVAIPLMQFDRRAFGFSLAIAVASAFLCGMGPAFQATRVDLVSTLKSGDRAPTRRRRPSGRNVLVALQIALSLVLLTIAIFAFHSFRQELSDGPGFRTTQIAKVTVDTSQARYSTERSRQFFARAVEAARALPGVRSAGLISIMPLSGFEFTAIVPEGLPLAQGQTSVRPMVSSIDEHYFDTMGIQLVSGRGFLPTDTEGAPRVAVVNDTLARHYWPAEDAVGKRFQMLNARGRPWVEVVGVVRTGSYGYAGEPPQDFVYYSFRQDTRGAMVLVAGTTGESASVISPLRDMLRELDASVPTMDAQTIEWFYAARAATIANVLLWLIAGMGGMGMTLTLIGLYGLVSYSVSRRTRELGIRIAIGAGYQRVLLMVLRQGMTPAFFGLVVGVALAIATMRTLPTLVPFDHQYDPRLFLIVVPLLLLTTALAAFVPARRAARVDPTVTLRCD